MVNKPHNYSNSSFNSYNKSHKLNSNKSHKPNSNKHPKTKANKYPNKIIISRMREKDIMLRHLLVDLHNNNKVIWIHLTNDIYYTKRTINIINDILKYIFIFIQ